MRRARDPSAPRRRDTRLYGDDELRVLWLVAGRHELALSADGLWLRGRRHQAELTWDEIDQIQTAVPFGSAGDGRVRVEVFARDGNVLVAGPFSGEEARRWLDAAAAAAAGGGALPRPLDGAAGFALQGRGAGPPAPVGQG